MSYQKQYCELKAGYTASEAKLAVLRSKLKALQMDPEATKEQLDLHKEQLRVQQELVAVTRKELNKLEAVIYNLSRQMKNIEIKVFHLRYVKGYTIPQIAKRLNYSESRIKQITRAIKKKVKGKQ